VITSPRISNCEVVELLVLRSIQRATSTCPSTEVASLLKITDFGVYSGSFTIPEKAARDSIG
jgi:hypothetical protein